MGDGGMTKYQICITLHHADDLEYSRYVVKLIKKIFKVVPNIAHVPQVSVNKIEVSRSSLVSYLNSLGLVVGNKIRQQIDIPAWIKNKPSYRVACIRGLIDTDGCVFVNKYKIGKKWYAYKKIDFASASAPLRQSVMDILRGFGMNPSTNGIHIRLNSKKDVWAYFKLIGSHNPKHLNKLKNSKNMLE